MRLTRRVSPLYRGSGTLNPDLARGGDQIITVFDKAPYGRTSDPKTFTVLNAIIKVP